MAEETEYSESADDASEEDQSRRQFIKKLAYIAPVVETFVMIDEAEAQDARRRNSRLRRNQVSPAPANASSTSRRGNSR